MKLPKYTFIGKGSLCFLLLTFICFSPSFLLSQGAIGIADRNANPIRVNMVRPQLNLPNAQRPPYEWSGAYLRNAFSTPGENPEVFLMDSSLCGNGQMDGTGFTNHLKVFYTYDGENQLSEVLYKHLRLGGAYENFSRKIYQYENGQQTLYSFQIWDNTTQNWKDDYQERITYDAEGRWDEFSSREQNESGEWEFVLREQISYDTAGNPKELIVSSGNGNSWEPTQRLEALFNEEGFYTHIYRQMWTGAAWDTTSRETTTFSAGNSRWRGYTLEEKNPSTGKLENVARELYAYNSYGFWVKTERQEWDQQLEAWQNMLQEEYTYTRRGVWIGWLQQVWQGGEWVNNIRQKYTPGSEGRADLVQEWDASAEDWTNAFRNVIKFDDDKNLEREMGTQKWDDATDSWSVLPETRRCIHAWSPLRTTSIRRPLPKLNCGIANPYSLRTPIYCESLELGKTYQVDMVDTQGRSVYQTKVRGGQHFSVNQPIANGIYYLQIQEGGQLKHMQKLLIRP